MRRATLIVMLLVLILGFRPATAAYPFALYLLPDGLKPLDIAIDPAGNAWFTAADAHLIGRMTPDGTLTQFPTGAESPRSILVYGGFVWFTTNAGHMGRMMPGGAIALIPRNGGGMTVGLDGRIWTARSGMFIATTTAGITESIPLSTTIGVADMEFDHSGMLWIATGQTKVMRYNPTTRALTAFAAPTNFTTETITVDPQGTVWVGRYLTRQIASVSPQGVFTPYPTVMQGFISDACSTSGGIWFNGFNASPSPASAGIEHRAMDGMPFAYSAPAVESIYNLACSEGAIWGADFEGGQLVRLALPVHALHIPALIR